MSPSQPIYDSRHAVPALAQPSLHWWSRHGFTTGRNARSKGAKPSPPVPPVCGATGWSRQGKALTIRFPRVGILLEITNFFNILPVLMMPH